MKKYLKLGLLSFLIFLIILSGMFFYVINVTKDARLDIDKLQTQENPTFLDCDEKEVYPRFVSHMSNISYDDLPDSIINALVCTEDKRFFKHNGVDYVGIARATVNNLKSRSFKEGGSTITQQLIKNTHLSNDKTVKRKLKEIKLAHQLEKKLPKKEILVAYLNTVYFGNNCFGINKAAKYYFDKDVAALDLSESAMLVGLLKAPNKYDPYINYDKAINRKDIVVKLMKKQGKISENECNYELNKSLVLAEHIENDEFYFKRCMDEVGEIISPYEYGGSIIYTYFRPEKQKLINDVLSSVESDCGKTAVILSDGKVEAYFSTENCENKTQPASTIKPLLVYAPSIDKGIISEATKICDEEYSFGDYSLKNYGDKYYGYIDCKSALAYSLNVPAVKILNSLTAKTANKYLNKTSLKNETENLSCALGNIDTLPSIKEIAESYSCFNDEGQFSKAKFVKKIVDRQGKVLYEDKHTKTKVFDKDTAYIVSDMLKACVEKGTAKKLNNNNFQVYAKTGTNGTKYGNVNALCIAYTSENIFGINLFAKNNKLLDNSISGGTYPCIALNKIITNYYENKYPKDLNIEENVCKVKLSKTAYDEDNVLMQSDDESFDKDVFYGYFKREYLPKLKDTHISNPTVKSIKIIDNIENYELFYEMQNGVDFDVYKSIDGNKKQKIYSSESHEKFIDYDIDHKEIVYTIVPYSYGKSGKITGEEITLPKIKKHLNVDGDKWFDEY